MSRSQLFSFLMVLGLSTVANAEEKSWYSEAAHQAAVEFAPGVISTKERFEINAVFNESGDKVIFARCADDFSTCTLMESRFKDGKWQPGKKLPFSGDYLDADPYYNADFSKIYYISKRPIKANGPETEAVNIWRVSETNGQWGEPEYLADLSSDAMDLYPSFTDKGELYFPSFRNEQRLLYVAKPQGQNYSAPVAIPAEVYGENAKIGDSAVSRDGNTIIFSIRGRADSVGNGDLYISHRQNGQWNTAKNLGNKVNTPDHEFTPILSPDGQYLFFTRVENGLGNIYQIHIGALDWR